MFNTEFSTGLCGLITSLNAAPLPTTMASTEQGPTNSRFITTVSFASFPASVATNFWYRFGEFKFRVCFVTLKALHQNEMGWAAKDLRCTEMLVSRTLVTPRVCASPTASVGNAKTSCTEKKEMIIIRSIIISHVQNTLLLTPVRTCYSHPSHTGGYHSVLHNTDVLVRLSHSTLQCDKALTKT